MLSVIFQYTENLVDSILLFSKWDKGLSIVNTDHVNKWNISMRRINLLQFVSGFM